jgi:hypothetical protein
MRLWTWVAVEDALEVGGKGLVRLAIEAELGDGAGFVPPRIVVVPRGVLQPQLQVVVGADPLAGVDHTPLEGGVDLRGRRRTGVAAIVPQTIGPCPMARTFPEGISDRP